MVEKFPALIEIETLLKKERIDTQLKQLEKQIEKLNRRKVDVRTETSSLNKVRTFVATAGKDIDRLNAAFSTNLSLQNDVQGKLRTTTSLSEALGKKTAETAARFGAYFIASRAVSAVARQLGAAFTNAVRFDRELVKVAQLSNTSISASRQLGREIGRLGTQYGLSSQKAVQAAQTFTQAGLSIGETQDLLRRLAPTNLTATFGDFNKTAESTLALMKQFGLQTSQTTQVFDSFNALTKQANVSVQELFEGLKRGGSAFASLAGTQTRAFGDPQNLRNLQEFAAVFASTIEVTRESAPTVGTALRTILPRLRRSETIDLLREYQIEITKTNKAGQELALGPAEALQKIAEGLRNIDPASLDFSRIVEQVAGLRQFNRFVAIVNNSSKAIELLEKAQKSQGSVADDVAIAQENLAVKIDELRERFAALLREFVNTPQFDQLADGLLSIAKAAANLTEALGPLIPALTAVLAVRTVAFGGIRGFGRGFRGQFGERFNSGGSSRGMTNALVTKGEIFVDDQVASKYGGASKLLSYNRLNVGGKIQGATQIQPGVHLFTAGLSANKDSVPTQLPPGVVIRRKGAARFIGENFNRGGSVGRLRFQTGADTGDARFIANLTQKNEQLAKTARETVQQLTNSGETLGSSLKLVASSVRKSADDASSIQNLIRIQAGTLSPTQAARDLRNPASSASLKSAASSVLRQGAPTRPSTTRGGGASAGLLEVPLRELGITADSAATRINQFEKDLAKLNIQTKEELRLEPVGGRTVSTRIQNQIRRGELRAANEARFEDVGLTRRPMSRETSLAIARTEGRAAARERRRIDRGQIPARQGVDVFSGSVADLKASLKETSKNIAKSISKSGPAGLVKDIAAGGRFVANAQVTRNIITAGKAAPAKITKFGGSLASSKLFQQTPGLTNAGIVGGIAGFGLSQFDNPNAQVAGSAISGASLGALAGPVGAAAGGLIALEGSIRATTEAAEISNLRKYATELSKVNDEVAAGTKTTQDQANALRQLSSEVASQRARVGSGENFVTRNLDRGFRGIQTLSASSILGRLSSPLGSGAQASLSRAGFFEREFANIRDAGSALIGRGGTARIALANRVGRETFDRTQAELSPEATRIRQEFTGALDSALQNAAISRGRVLSDKEATQIANNVLNKTLTRDETRVLAQADERSLTRPLETVEKLIVQELGNSTAKQAKAAALTAITLNRANSAVRIFSDQIEASSTRLTNLQTDLSVSSAAFRAIGSNNVVSTNLRGNFSNLTGVSPGALNARLGSVARTGILGSATGAATGLVRGAAAVRNNLPGFFNAQIASGSLGSGAKAIEGFRRFSEQGNLSPETRKVIDKFIAENVEELQKLDFSDRSGKVEDFIKKLGDSKGFTDAIKLLEEGTKTLNAQYKELGDRLNSVNKSLRAFDTAQLSFNQRLFQQQRGLQNFLGTGPLQNTAGATQQAFGFQTAQTAALTGNINPLNNRAISDRIINNRNRLQTLQTQPGTEIEQAALRLENQRLTQALDRNTQQTMALTAIQQEQVSIDQARQGSRTLLERIAGGGPREAANITRELANFRQLVSGRGGAVRPEDRLTAINTARQVASSLNANQLESGRFSGVFGTEVRSTKDLENAIFRAFGGLADRLAGNRETRDILRGAINPNALTGPENRAEADLINRRQQLLDLENAARQEQLRLQRDLIDRQIQLAQTLANATINVGFTTPLVIQGTQGLTQQISNGVSQALQQQISGLSNQITQLSNNRRT